MKKRVAIAAACAALALAGCDGGKATQARKAPATLDSVSLEDLSALAGKKIFFGHQSVGWNIIDGLKDIAREKGGAGFDFVEARTPGDGPGFYHAAIGRNEDPLGKISDFEAIMRGGMGSKADVALMKFCYVDFVPETDVEAVFASYRDTMNRLEADFPGVAFVRVAVPLTAEEKGIKPLIKRLLGRSTYSQRCNIVRERFNALLRSDCESGSKPLFDLAMAEATAPDGSIARYAYKNESYYALRDAYTTDGGHLSESGRRAVALEMLGVLSAVSRGE